MLNVISACSNLVDSRSDFGHFRRLILMLSQKALLKVERKYFKVLDALNEKKLAYRDLWDCKVAGLGPSAGVQSNRVGMTVQEAERAVELCEQEVQKSYLDFHRTARKMGKICMLLESFQTRTPAFLVVIIGTVAWQAMRQSFSCWWLLVIAYCIQLLISLIGPTAGQRKERWKRYRQLVEVLNRNKSI